MSVNVNLDLKHLEQLIKDCEKAKNLQLEIGVLADKTYDDENKTPVADVATYLEYGWVQTVKPKQSKWFMANGIYNIKTGATLTMPPRPTFKATAEAKKDDWIEIGQYYLKGLTDNPLNKITEALRAIGTAAVQDIQDTITNGGVEGEMFAPRSPLTMLMYSQSAEKGGHKVSGVNNTTTTKPLTKSGKFANSIAFDIING